MHICLNFCDVGIRVATEPVLLTILNKYGNIVAYLKMSCLPFSASTSWRKMEMPFSFMLIHLFMDAATPKLARVI
jgi:hypothetical protein